MFDLSLQDALIRTYLKDIQHLENQQVSHELGLKGPFQNLLDKAARKRGWSLIPELTTFFGGKRINDHLQSATNISKIVLLWQ